MSLFAAEQLGLRDLLAVGEEKTRLEAVEARLEELLALVGALLLGLEAVDHDDEPQPVLHRGADEAVARLLGEAGLEAVRSDRHRQQRIAVVLADLVPGELALAVDFVILG